MSRWKKRTFTYEEQPAPAHTLFTRTAWVGAERVRDIINTYDTESYKLPYGMENDSFKISWKVGEGIYFLFYNKKMQRWKCASPDWRLSLLLSMSVPKIRKGVYEERRLIGRNIRGLHAEQYQGDLKDVKLLDHGPVFTKVELVFDLEGTYYSSVIIKMYNKLPKIEFSYHIAKTLSEDIESVFMPLALNLPDAEVSIQNGGVAMRPGIDQLPGTNMEYYLADEGLIYRTKDQTILVNTFDTPLLYMGAMESHPILLCDNREENQQASGLQLDHEQYLGDKLQDGSVRLQRIPLRRGDRRQRFCKMKAWSVCLITIRAL